MAIGRAMAHGKRTILPDLRDRGAPVMIVGEPLRDFREKAGGEECSERDEQAVQLLAGFAGVAIDRARPYTGLKACHSELRRATDALKATTRNPAAGR